MTLLADYLERTRQGSEFYTQRSQRSLRPIRMDHPFRFPDPVSLRSLCGLSFLIGILHTEIAKITKTDSDWITLFDSLTLFLCVLCDLRVDRLEGDSYFRG
jgi:hypothetical protein